jgi:hypothetical protein
MNSNLSARGTAAGRKGARMSATTDASTHTDKNPQELYAERDQRFKDALALRPTDRVPISVRFGSLLADMEGVTRQAMYEDTELAYGALEHAMLRFQPDHGSGLYHTPGPSAALGDRSTKWPGYGNGPNVSFQFNEHEFMKAEDYDAFLEDPADFAIRTYLPRVFSQLEAFAQFPPLAFTMLGYYSMMQFIHLFTTPEMVKAFESLCRAAQAQVVWIEAARESSRRLAALGFASFPIMAGALVHAPFDFMSDTLRGMKGIFLDLRHNPDKLLAAEEKIIGPQVETAIAICRGRNCPYAFFPLHRGSDGFISIPVFERFYWPQLRTMFLRLIAAGITPVVFYEGVWDQRLKYLAELPAGKTVGLFQRSDLFKVKEVLGDVMCIVGGMPVSMLFGARPDEVRNHTRRICETLGKGGGFVMSTDVGELEGCNPELIKVWIDTTKETLLS